MFCPKCGAQNAPGAQFCSGCGAPLVAQQPQQQYRQPQPQGQPQYRSQVQQTVGRAAGKAASGAAKKAGGGLLKKILIGFAVIAGISTVYTAIDVMRQDNGGNSTVTNGGGTTVTGKGVTLSLSKTTLKAGEMLVISYSGVTQEMIDDFCFIGIAPESTGSAGYTRTEYITDASGTVEFEAPPAAGQYEARFYKANGGLDENITARVSFTVEAEEVELGLPVFTETLRIIWSDFDETIPAAQRPTGVVSMSGSDVTITLEPYEYTRNYNEKPVDYSFSGVYLTGTVEKVERQSYGTAYFVGLNGGFSFVHHETQKKLDTVCTFDNRADGTYSEGSRAIVYLFEDGFRECEIFLTGSADWKFITPEDTNVTHGADELVRFTLTQNGEDFRPF